MAAFSSSSYQHPLFLGDPAFSPTLSAIKMDGSLDGFMPNFRQFYSIAGDYQIPAVQDQEGCSFDASAHESSCVEQQSVHNEPSLNQKQRNESLSMVDKAESGEQVTQNWLPADKKRKCRKGSSPNSANSKDAKKGKCKKQKGDKEEGKNDHNRVTEEPPKGYIHVRARRGQATDSHSLAERVRRGKISERMRTLQALVPGCDKVTGKALMLDEIINYVQSLQNQVEFLSMKLASLDPTVYTFGLMDLDAMLFVTEAQGMNNSMAIPTPSVQPSSHPPDFSNVNAAGLTSTTTCSTTPTTLLQHEEKPNSLALQQDVGSSYWGVNEQVRQRLINQIGIMSGNNNLYTQ